MTVNMNQTTDVQQLLLLIRQLEARIAQLEGYLSKSGTSVLLKNGSSSITLAPHAMKIEAMEISIKAAGQLVLKGANLPQI